MKENTTFSKMFKNMTNSDSRLGLKLPFRSNYLLAMNQESSSTEKQKTFSEIKAEMKSRGFTFVGREPLTRFEFTEDTRFIAKPFRTKEDVCKAYTDQFKRECCLDVEIELVNDTSLTQDQKAVYVFAKKKK